MARRIHVFCAAGLWSCIGIFLIYRGTTLLHAADALWLALPALLLGNLKSRLVLDRVARGGLERIELFSDNTCIGAVYSWQTWLLVLAMAGMGMILRRLQLSPLLIGSVSLAIGTALTLSSRFAWRAWLNWKRRHD